MIIMMTIAALLIAGAVQAQAIHKCVHEGKTSYSELPCEQGAASVLDVPAARPADPAAKAALRREQKEAAQLEKQRKAREAREDREDAALNRQAAERRRRCGKLALDRKWADEDVRRAAPQAVDAARLKARRSAERWASECG
jgi:hypothetical protein